MLTAKVTTSVLAVALGLACVSHAGAQSERKKEAGPGESSSTKDLAMDLSAQWIWNARQDYQSYNDTIVARKTFSAPAVRHARMAITADTRYRLFINGTWVNDGPCRSWPAHYQYDELDVTDHLRPGENEIRVIAKYFGVGTFHQIPQQAGLLVQLDVVPAEGAPFSVVSDASWEVADAAGWRSNSPKACVQMGPFEVFDARRESEAPFQKATILYGTHEGPWQDLNPRDCPLLTKAPFALCTFTGASVVRKDWLSFGFPTAQLLYPGAVKANNHNSMASAVATVVECGADRTLRIEAPGSTVIVNGKRGRGGEFQLKRGANLLCAVVTSYFGHWRQDNEIRFVDTEGFELRNPLDGNADNPWCFVPFEDAKFQSSDIGYALMDPPERDTLDKRIRGAIRAHQKRMTDLATFRQEYGGQAQTLSSSQELFDSVHWQFKSRDVLGDAAELVENPGALIEDNAVSTLVHPSGDGDIELVYDLGEQNCGYYRFDLTAEEGLAVDIFGVEYLTPTGRVQHTQNYRNGMRYVCKEGRNQFTSLLRRSGRYLFITLRKQTKPVAIRHVQLVESTYPVQETGRFACSDPALGRIWEISARTLKLCMEDSFTDCPVYEQTLWVGDARNEAVFGFTAFGAHDLARRCIRLAAQSLEQYPIVLCQVPSTWETLLPAWSFLWGISVWDYYAYSGDKALLTEVWPLVIQNLEGAEGYSDACGLFSGPFWNMFDWSGIDDGHHTVLHNSMFVVGAIDAALKCGEALGDASKDAWLKAYRTKLVAGLNALWDGEKRAYPDSVHNDGTVSGSTSIHTHFLSLLYDIAGEENRGSVLGNMLSPPEGMVRVGSPFAIMYLYEALEKAGHADRIIASIQESYAPMLELGATTVWESFASGTTGGSGFPTRSHCHAWSSAPIHFLNRIILGIVPEGAGGRAFTISPRMNGLSWAKGASASINGPVEVSWSLSGKTLAVTASAPEDAALQFIRNDSHDGLTVTFNATPVP